MATDYRKIAQDIYDYFKEFGIEQASNCMTRLRIKISKHQGISQEKVKAIPGVLGLVVAGDEYQVILGPGIVIKVYDEFSHIIKQNIGNINEQKKATPTAVKDIAEINKAENKKNRQNNPVAIALSKFAKIFTPLLPAFIAAGILSAVAGIIQASVQNDFTDHIVAKE
jgi:phosphotransferase system IIB component